MTIEDEDIEELILAPKVMQGDEGRIEERPIDDIIKGQQFIAAQQASTNPPGGMRVAKARFPGSA